MATIEDALAAIATYAGEERVNRERAAQILAVGLEMTQDPIDLTFALVSAIVLLASRQVSAGRGSNEARFVADVLLDAAGNAILDARIPLGESLLRTACARAMAPDDVIETPFAQPYPHPVDVPLDARELDLLARLDGPPPLETVTVSRSVHALAIRAVREIQRHRRAREPGTSRLCD